jgi:hypothetical protein
MVEILEPKDLPQSVVPTQVPPQIIMTPTPQQPQSQYLPPSKFLSPIVVAETIEKSSPTPFLPTPNKILDDIQFETTTKSVLVNLFAFGKAINTSFMPPELHAVKDSIESNDLQGLSSNVDEIDDSHELDKNSSATPASDLHKFPPNINSLYLPAMENSEPISLTNSYLPPPSGEYRHFYLPPPNASLESDVIGDTAIIPPSDLHKFPPNIESSYLPPSPVENANDMILSTSYFPQPSGQINSNDVVVDTKYLPPQNLTNFPPNVNSYYLPPPLISTTSEEVSNEPSRIPKINPQSLNSGGMMMMVKLPYNYEKPSGPMMPPQNDMMQSAPGVIDVSMSAPSGPG